MLKIAFDPEKSSDQVITFVGGSRSVDVRLTWNTYSTAWYITVGSCGPRKLLPNVPVLRSVKYVEDLDGDFILKKTSVNAPEFPGYSDLGSSWVLCYATSAEVEAWENKNGLG